MPGTLNVITGATGLLGSHIAEQLVATGHRVRALVRPTSDVAFLNSLGVEIVRGDLLDGEYLRRAVEGADTVYHCAALVGDWGPWSAYESAIIGVTRQLLDACQFAQVKRFLHVSSIIVYGHPKERGTPFTEEEPLGKSLWWWGDNYCRAKIAAEEMCWAYPGAMTIVRPSWIYGPRDRRTLPRVFKALEAGMISIIGSGNNLLNIIYASDVADGAIRAANHPDAVGRVYNLSSEGELTQRTFLNLLTDALHKPRVRWRFPYRLAFAGGFISEMIGRAIRLKRPPHFTRYAVALIGRPTTFSVQRAREELGWRPRVAAADGVQRTLDWYWSQNGKV